MSTTEPTHPHASETGTPPNEAKSHTDAHAVPSVDAAHAQQHKPHHQPHPHAANDNHHPQYTIGGAGITGLYAADYLIKKGVPASNITILDAANRTGGHIETAIMDGIVVNKGAEFLDSDQHKILALCTLPGRAANDNGLNIRLKENRDQASLRMSLPDGKPMEEAEFMAAYAPIAERIAKIKQELVEDPTGPLAQTLSAMSLDDFLDALAVETSVRKNPGVFRRLWNMVTFNSNRVNPKVIAMAKQAYSSEGGNKAHNINALAFVNEASAAPDGFLASDCKYRVEGGMQTITDELTRYLKEQGVHFELNAPVTAIHRDEHGKLHLTIGGAHPHEKATDLFIPAMPAYNLKTIKGLEDLGMSREVFDTIATAQYTNSIKFSVRLKDGVTADQIRFANGQSTAADSTFFSAKGYQCWSSHPGMLTFLVNADDVTSGKMGMKPFIESCMADYAVVNGRNPDDIYFPVDANSVVLSNPGVSPCYASAAPGQFLSLIGLGHSMDKMAANGVAVAGTFIPYRTADGSYSTGFMEGGLHSAEHACDMLIEHHRAHGHAPMKWVDRLHQQQHGHGAHTQPPHATTHTTTHANDAHPVAKDHATHPEHTAVHGQHTAAVEAAAANNNQPLATAR